eukprot:3940710-Rhodomonas_salina.1
MGAGVSGKTGEKRERKRMETCLPYTSVQNSLHRNVITSRSLANGALSSGSVQTTQLQSVSRTERQERKRERGRCERRGRHHAAQKSPNEPFRGLGGAGGDRKGTEREEDAGAKTEPVFGVALCQLAAHLESNLVQLFLRRMPS